MTKDEIVRRLIEIGKIKDGSSPFIGCDTIGQEGLYEVQAGILNLLESLDQPAAFKAFPYMYERAK